MKKLLVMLLVSLVATSAFAVVDEDPDMLGVYFDTAADMNELAIGASVPFYAYVTITNPSASHVHGLEFGYSIVSSVGPGTMFRLASTLPAQAIDLGTNTDIYNGDYIVGLGTPLPGTPAVQFVTWQFMLLTVQTLEFYLGPSSVPSLSDGMPAYEIGGSILPLGLATGGVDTPVAVVNGTGPVAVEETSFGSVKSLFR